jgi:hypothetical protein
MKPMTNMKNTPEKPQRGAVRPSNPPKPRPQSDQKPSQQENVVEALQAAGEAFEKSEGTFSKQRAYFVAKIVIVARSVVASEDAWTRLCAADYWRERKRDIPKVRKPSKVLLRCFQLALNAREHPQIVAASRFAKALHDFLDGEHSQEEIANEIIDAGGIDGLLKRKRDPKDHLLIWLDPAEYPEVTLKIESAPVGSNFKIIATVCSDEAGAHWLSLERIVRLKANEG